MPRFLLPIETTYGTFVARYSLRGLVGLDFPSGKDSTLNDVAPPPDVCQWHQTTIAAVERVLTGKRLQALPPLDLVGTAFQKSVWAALQTIETGRTMTYGELAASVGKPKAARAIGSACGANPIPVLIPCHRVLASNGKLGGFSAGLSWKKILLSLEGNCLERQAQHSTLL